MANPYPALITDANSETRVAGQINFTDPANQPGGSSPVNWALIQPIIPDPLGVANSQYYWEEAGLSIQSQSGSDFSVGTGFRGKGAIFSASGGRFQAGAYFGAPTGDLDGGSTLPRYLSLGIDIGDSVAPSSADLFNLGYDCTVPVQLNNEGQVTQTFSSLIGYAGPGGQALGYISATLLNAFGTDSVFLNLTFGWPMIALWQV